MGWKEYPMYRYGLTQAMPDMCLEEMEAGNVKGVWTQTSNGIACMSCEVDRWYQAMKVREGGKREDFARRNRFRWFPVPA